MFTRKMDLEDRINRHVALQNGAQTPNAYGIEVELEGRHIVTFDPEILSYWSHHQDGSLRKILPFSEAIEYVSARPWSLPHTEKAIQLLFNYLNKPGVEVFDSYRTSIHVHVNYSQETFRVVYNAMVLSIILDELLVSQNGEHRIGNNFCLRSKDAMGQIVQLIHSIEQNHNFFGVVQNDRYSSINFASLCKFGTIEYRSLECTTHEGRLLHWIGTLQQIKEASKPFKNPMEIIQQFSRFEPKAFLQATLGPYAVKYLKVDGYENMLRNGMRIAQDLAFCSAWNEGSAGARE